jgi:uncharacterized membrane protein
LSHRSNRQKRLANNQNQQQQTSLFQIAHKSIQFSGPLPPPEILVRYNDAVPGGAERIVAMAEKQQEHRHRLESAVVMANCRTQQIGQVLGSIVCMTAIIGGVYLINKGHSITGATAAITAVAGLVSVFIAGRRKQTRELAEKSEALAPVRPTEYRVPQSPLPPTP